MSTYANILYVHFTWGKKLKNKGDVGLFIQSSFFQPASNIWCSLLVTWVWSKWNMAAIWKSPVGSSALCMWGMVSVAFLHACSLSLCPFLLFLSVPCLSFCLFHSSMFWWRSMVLHVLVKGLVGWDFRCCGSSYMNADNVIWFKMGQTVLTDHFRWVQVATQDAKVFVLSKQYASVVYHHPPKSRLTCYWCLTHVRYFYPIGTCVYTHKCTIWQTLQKYAGL